MTETTVTQVQRLNWAVILFLTLHTAGAIWWASRIQAGFDYMSQQIAELKSELRLVNQDRYTAVEAQKDTQLILERYNMLNIRISRLESKIFNGTKP